MAGCFIVFEGIDGSGKSTQAALLAGALASQGRTVFATREPTAESPAAARLREIAAGGRKDTSPEQEAALFFEDRAWHVSEQIAPALARGETVVCDRYWYSTAAYQGALGADAAKIASESRARFPEPDLVIYLRVEPEQAFERIRKGRDSLQAGYEKREFLEKVFAQYEAQVSEDWLVLDGTRGEKEIAADIAAAISKLLG